MSKSQNRISRVQAAFRTHFLAIVLAVISIIQGLAFNDLATRFSPIYFSAVKLSNFIALTHFALCFALLLRVFQTYITAALDYERWKLGFFDLLTIFGVGLLEYFVFSSLLPEGFDPYIFHSRLLILSSLAFFGYLRALAIIYRSRHDADRFDQQYFRNEVRLQLVNLLGTALLMSLSIYVIATNESDTRTLMWIGIVGALTLIVNIAISIGWTFGKPQIEVEYLEGADASPGPTIGLRSGSNVQIRQARKSDIEALLDLGIENFGYVYAVLFDTSPRLTRQIVRAVFSAAGGKHEWGYGRFYVAEDDESGEVVGLIKYEVPVGRPATGHFLSLLILSLIVIRFLGVVGIVRVVRNSREVRAATYPLLDHDELHIHYLAVAPEARSRGIGTRLVDFASLRAVELGKSAVSLEVRETNRRGRSLFRRMGFVEAARIKTEFDFLFGKGGRIRLKREV